MNTAATADVRSHKDRRKARVAALQVLYEIDGARHDPGRVFESRSNESGLSRPSEEYARRLVEGFLENREEIDSTISTYAPTWPIRQIAMVDRNLLRLAVFEIVKDAETPPKVAINEAVEMGKIPIIPTGAVEQHGHHLPLKVDHLCANAVATEAARLKAEFALVIAHQLQADVMDPDSRTIRVFRGIHGNFEFTW